MGLQPIPFGHSGTDPDFAHRIALTALRMNIRLTRNNLPFIIPFCKQNYPPFTCVIVKSAGTRLDGIVKTDIALNVLSVLFTAIFIGLLLSTARISAFGAGK